MKSFKLLIAGAFVFALLTPILWGRAVNAQVAVEPEFLECFSQTQEPEGNCDMAILKEVSVNGGAFVDANTSPDAVNAVIGDTVTWRITVTNESTGDYGSPLFTVWISDVLPAGFNLESAVPSDGSFSSNTWELPLITEVGEGFFSNLPAVLTLTTTATATGLSENVAAFSEYDGCGDDCVGPYADDESDNNSDSAWVNISAAPVVLGESTPVVLAATGSGVIESLVAAALIGSTLLTLGYSRFAGRKG